MAERSGKSRLDSYLEETQIEEQFVYKEADDPEDRSYDSFIDYVLHFLVDFHSEDFGGRDKLSLPEDRENGFVNYSRFDVNKLHKGIMKKYGVSFENPKNNSDLGKALMYLSDQSADKFLNKEGQGEFKAYTTGISLEQLNEIIISKNTV